MLKRTLAPLLLSAASLMAGVATQSEQISDPAKPWWEWDNATGDWFGARTTLQDHGVDLFGSYSAEVWGNTTGGLKQATVYTGLMTFGTEVDLEKLVGWKGATVSTTWLWLSGRDASEDLAGNFLTVSNIAGFNTLRMLEMWFQQNLFDDKLSIRVGQITADSEFLTSTYSSLFLNGTFGWAPSMYTNLPEGGPGYPMGTLGVRVAVNPFDWLTLQSAVFQGNVFAQTANRHGFRWDLDSNNGYFWMNEIQGRWNQGEETFALPGEAKFGVWFHTGSFADPYYDEDGIPLADSSSTGIPQDHDWNYGFYWVLDQMLFREAPSVVTTEGLSKDGKGVVSKNPQTVEKPSQQGLGFFGRIAFQPQDRNFLGFYFDTGLVYTGLIPTRDEDRLGVGFAYAQLSNGAQDNLELEGSTGVGAEMAVEFSYEAVITPWLSVQPDAQLIINPGGTQDLNNAFLVGGRVTVTF
ncbi:MAG: carbohydrate porin [Verrucomicrobia bacterium]|nr:carbohydrate porin [Verrucomicrobiota bacterium]